MNNDFDAYKNKKAWIHLSNPIPETFLQEKQLKKVSSKNSFVHSIVAKILCMHGNGVLLEVMECKSDLDDLLNIKINKHLFLPMSKIDSILLEF